MRRDELRPSLGDEQYGFKWLQTQDLPDNIFREINAIDLRGQFPHQANT
jgi:hypothetical protein